MLEVPGDLSLNGAVVEEVVVRLKGRCGSYRPMSRKAGSKVDINPRKELDAATIRSCQQDTLRWIETRDIVLAGWGL